MNSRHSDIDCMNSIAKAIIEEAFVQKQELEIDTEETRIKSISNMF
ncbi:MAG: hypothetical protein NTY15_15835 [Planctomycetota bacterium]|nr:hypothetical protein [Planctomycetota bacterium]